MTKRRDRAERRPAGAMLVAGCAHGTVSRCRRCDGMSLKDATRLRLLAVEALAISANMTDAECRRIVAGVAAGYERLAVHVEKRQAAESADPTTAAHSDTSDGKHRSRRSGCLADPPGLRSRGSARCRPMLFGRSRLPLS